MVPFVIFWRRLGRKLTEAFYGAIMSTVIVIIYGTFSEYYLENPYAASGIHSLFRSLWWVFQTITTVGYGDTPVVSFWGRINAMVIMVFGIGSLGVFTASIAANLVEMNVAAKLGERRIRMKDHIIVCNYDEGFSEIVGELNESGKEVVLVDREDPKQSKNVYTFVKGSCSTDHDLENAGIKNASKIIVLPERGVHDASAADAKTILTSIIIRKNKSDAYIITEIFKEENREHAKQAGVNEVVVRGAMSTLLVATAVTSPGVSKLFYELLRGGDGYRIMEYSLDSKFRGKPCIDVYKEMDQEGRVVLGFRAENDIKIRPSNESVNVWNSVIVMEPRNR